MEHERASQQWNDLVGNLRLAGAEVVTMDPHPEVPDLVFTANAGIVNGEQFVPSHFRHPERQGETAINAAWFAEQGFRVDRLPVGARPRRRRRRAPVHPGGRPHRARVGLLLPQRRGGHHRARDAARLPHQGRAARRPAPVPPRPHVLPARRAPRPVRAHGLGQLRPQGDRSARAGAPLAGGRRGPQLLRQLRRGRRHDRDAEHAAAGRPPARAVGLHRRREPGRRVPQGRRRLPVPHARARYCPHPDGDDRARPRASGARQPGPRPRGLAGRARGGPRRSTGWPGCRSATSSRATPT